MPTSEPFIKTSWTSHVVSNVVGGALGGILIVLRDASYASYIFPTQQHLLQPVFSGMLWSGIVAQVVYLARARLPGMITGTSSTATPFIASAAAVMTTTTESVFAFMLLTGLMSGLVTYLCGVFNLSRFLHFFPLPVTKGFFAAIGVSMIIGGCNMSASLKLTTLASWYKLTDMTTLLQLASCIAFGLACKLVKSKSKYVWGFPVFVLLVLGLFFAILFASQGDLDSARQSGWLFATPTESTSFYSFWTMLNPVKVDWSTWTTAAPIALITLFFFLPIDLILSLAALEDLYDEFGNLKSTATPTSDPTTNTTKWSINDELKTGGLAALFASLSGGLGVSYMALSPSRIAFDSGATSNLASVTSLIISVVTLVVGSSMVSFLPPFYVGGLLFYAGIGYLLDGVLDGIQFYTKPEYLVIWIIAITSIFFGSFAAIGIGIVLASLLFIARYSHSPFVRLIKQIKPNSDSPMAAKVVHQHNEDIAVMYLQGFLFFGSVESLSAHVDQLLIDTPTTKTLILDFELVFGLDGSALQSIAKLQQKLLDHQILLLFSSIDVSSDSEMSTSVEPTIEVDPTYLLSNEPITSASQQTDTSDNRHKFYKQMSRCGLLQSSMAFQSLSLAILWCELQMFKFKSDSVSQPATPKLAPSVEPPEAETGLVRSKSLPFNFHPDNVEHQDSIDELQLVLCNNPLLNAALVWRRDHEQDNLLSMNSDRTSELRSSIQLRPMNVKRRASDSSITRKFSTNDFGQCDALAASASSASGRKVSPAQVQLALQMHMPNSRACNFAPGQRVFANTFSANVAGADLARQLCFLESGEIEITAPSKSGQLNSTRILPGEVFNHSFNTFDSSLPAIARSHCSVRAIPSDEFDALQSENAAVASAIQQLQINSLTAQLQRSLAG